MKTKTIKCNFKNSREQIIDARLDLPADTRLATETKAFIIFCHCFTCSKETITTFRLSRLLAENGFAVLRFDFSGLGNSEGDFADTTFSNMQDDLHSAVDFLSEHYQPPEFLMGHSLGGTTALSIAQGHDSVKGVVTVASPSEPEHVLHHFSHALTLLEQNIAASFEVAGQYYDIKPGFVEDVRSFDMPYVLSGLDKPVLIFNIENDVLVSERDSQQIQEWAGGATCLLNVSGSDHLLSGREATRFVADEIVQWISGIV